MIRPHGATGLDPGQGIVLLTSASVEKLCLASLQCTFPWRLDGQFNHSEAAPPVSPDEDSKRPSLAVPGHKSASKLNVPGHRAVNVLELISPRHVDWAPFWANRILHRSDRGEIWGRSRVPRRESEQGGHDNQPYSEDDFLPTRDRPLRSTADPHHCVPGRPTGTSASHAAPCDRHRHACRASPSSRASSSGDHRRRPIPGQPRR